MLSVQSTAVTMTSLEIANLVELRHDNVKRTIETLIDSGVIIQPQFEVEQSLDSMGRQRTTKVYLIDQRSSYIIVAQLSPAFTARLVDRWQELEAQIVKNPTLPPTANMEAMLLAPMAIDAAKAFGFVGNHATLSANKAVKALTSIDLLAAMGNTHLIADKKALTFTPTEIGTQLRPPASAKAVNILLERAGLQLKNHKQWLPTNTGVSHCEVLDTGKKNSSGVPVKQVKWFTSVIELI
jgi:phage regulator Rha-like protein